MISVVIPAYNEEENIANALEGLVKQKTREKFEVILVNNNSTDSTVRIAKRFKNKLDLRIITEKKKGRGAARHRGFENAKGEIILSTDADVVVPENWIDTLARELRTSGAVAISGSLTVSDLVWFRNFAINQSFLPFMGLYKIVFGHYYLNEFSFAIWKKVYDKVGGFNTDINTQEGVELSFKVRKVGKIKMNIKVPVNFSGRRYRRGLIRGFIPYATTFVAYFILKKKNVILPDVR